MGKEELKKRNQAFKERDVLRYPEKIFEKSNVKTITYQFNNNSNTLYEFIIEYCNKAAAIAIAKNCTNNQMMVQKIFS